MSDFVRIDGLVELNSFFNEVSDFNDREKRKGIITLLRNASQRTIKQAKSNLKERVENKTGNLYKSLGSVSVKGRLMVIGMARTNKGFKGFHGHLIDKGTGDRTNEKGANRGKIQATNFFSNAINQTQSINEREIENDFVKLFDKWQKTALKKIMK